MYYLAVVSVALQSVLGNGAGDVVEVFRGDNAVFADPVDRVHAVFVGYACAADANIGELDANAAVALGGFDGCAHRLLRGVDVRYNALSQAAAGRCAVSDNLYMAVVRRFPADNGKNLRRSDIYRRKGFGVLHCYSILRLVNV